MERDPAFVEYVDRRTRLLEGTLGSSLMNGVWPINGNRVNKRWGLLRHHDFNEGLPAEWLDDPGPIDAVAKRNRVFAYERCRGAEDIIRALRHRHVHSISLALEITEAWRNPPGGVIPSSDDSPVGGHTVNVESFSDPVAQEFEFQNWWKDWGTDKRGFIKADEIDRRIVEAWVFHFGTPGGQPSQDIGRTRFTYASAYSATGQHLFVGTATDISTGDPIGWSSAVERGQDIDLEELFVMPDRRREGIASHLFERIRVLSFQRDRTIRVWVPYADAEARNQAALIGFFSRNRIRLETSGVRWAAFLGVKGKPTAWLPEVEFPHKAAYIFTSDAKAASTSKSPEEGTVFRAAEQDFRRELQYLLKRERETLERLA